ncbi:four-carbon acid sugar kinase family protein [Allochromatium vinosum]|uniref:Type III effector Hrp-dependent outers n=1 Tax=Allochromatium vinosum (strain ATCC 17899 / DSM 180 / NBRC 103801 / NCIMB 10441 / D) TaxID=572477 RepID=D3RR80_ALLVD|nr:four-carbon acid sugar kinase family protein [Allochromatium vinosum]ADC61908.1 type III effector Hrp-dependent outers [Allochromatium vinosum DSM 180]
MNDSPKTKIIAIDDDPTGCQTVHSCLLLTRWDVETLVEALNDESPLFFVLSNTRGLDAVQAAAVTREICVNLRAALDRLAGDGQSIRPLIVSRSDSTLRGHYPVETDVIAEKLGPFDAHFLVPAFFEGGRITRDGVHYLLVDGRPVPVNETEFARDSVFGYRHAFLPDYVAEKTGGRIRADQVERFGLDDVRGEIGARLLSLNGNRCCVVDAERQADLDGFARQVLAAVGEGKRFLFRSAASLLTAFAALPPQPVAARSMSAYVRGGRPGVVLVGSHVAKSSRQLQTLIETTDVAPVEIDLEHLVQDEAGLFDTIIDRLETAQHENRNLVLYTSRGERQFPTTAERLAFGERVSGFLVRIVQNLPRETGFLISKGGITSNDTLSRGLALRTARVLGQILPGCPVVRCPADHPRLPELPVVIFPGNVGDDASLAEIYRVLTLRG